MVGWHGNPSSLVVEGYAMDHCLVAIYRGAEHIVWFEGSGPWLDRQRQGRTRRLGFPPRSAKSDRGRDRKMSFVLASKYPATLAKALLPH